MRKGELSRSRLRREWPHHVALPAEAVRGLENADTVRGFVASLQAAALAYHRTDPDRVVLCFAKPEAAQAFAERFGGELLPVVEEKTGRGRRH